MLPGVSLINFQSRQALNVLKEAVAEGRVLAPVFCQQLLCEFLHRDDGHRDERHTAQQDDSRPCMDAHQQDEQGQGSQQAVKQLGQILCEVGVDLLDALTRQHDDFAGGDGLAVTGTQTGELGVDVGAERPLDILGCLVAHGRGADGKAIPHRNGGDAEEHPLYKAALGQGPIKDRTQQPGNDGHKDDIAEHPEPLEQNVQADVAQCAAVKGKQFFVDHWAFSISNSSSGSYSPNRRSYSPVKARSGRAAVSARAAVSFSSSVSSMLTGGKCSNTAFN